MKCNITEKIKTMYASYISNSYVTCFEYTAGEKETAVWGSCTVDISKIYDSTRLYTLERVVENGCFYASSMDESWGIFSALPNAGEYVAEVCWDIIPENLQKYNTHVKVEKKQRGRGKPKAVDCISVPVTNIYVHDLKKEGNTLLSYLLNTGFRENSKKDGVGVECWLYTPNSMRSVISDDTGEFYMLGVRLEDRVIIFKNLSTLIPANIEDIERDFHTILKLLPLENKEEKKAGDPLSLQEKESMLHKCMVLGETLYFLFLHYVNGLTIGSTSLGIYKRGIGIQTFEKLFPKVEKGLDAFLRRSYFGGWCYIKEGCEGLLLSGGCSYDINSHFPSMMHSSSGNVYPYGLPILDDVTLCRDKTPEQILQYIKAGVESGETYSFLEFSCNFELKEDRLPFIRIKTEEGVDSGVCLKSSKNEVGHAVTLVMSQTDFCLMLEQYDIQDFECLRILAFKAKAGMFDDYINEFYYLKTRSQGAERALYKLLLNNLYGKFGSFLERAVVTPYLSEDGVIQFKQEGGTSSFWGYIPVACACTSYARAFTVRHAQKNFDIFIYSDSDSIKTKGKSSGVCGLDVHPVQLGKWKMEYGKEWDEAIFVKKKTYIITVGDTYDIKASGLSDRGKELFLYYLKCYNLKDNKDEYVNYINSLELTEHEEEWLNAMLSPRFTFKRKGDKQGRTLYNEKYQGMRAFRQGLIIPSNCRTMAISGGVTVVDGYYSISE